jgi:hypothetical protein
MIAAFILTGSDGSGPGLAIAVIAFAIVGPVVVGLIWRLADRRRAARDAARDPQEAVSGSAGA